MVVIPAFTPEANPPAVIVALVMSEEDQITSPVLVTSFVDPFVNVAVAVNCCVAFTLTLGLVGVTATEAITGEVTVTVVVIGVSVPQVAVIVLEPAVAAFTVFEAPVVALRVTAALDELQVQAAKLEAGAAVPSVSVPLNCRVLVAPWAKDKLVVENEKELSVAGPTVKVMVPVTPLTVAVMTTVP
jgi:hypothetical protein